jgi:hypothetical protein
MRKLGKPFGTPFVSMLSWSSCPCSEKNLNTPEGKFFVSKVEYGGSFDMILEGDCHEVEITLNL